jgi:hypothetical protein
MDQHGRILAASHELAPGSAPDQLLARLAANEIALVGVCQLLTGADTEKQPDHAGRRMATRQLLSDRRTDPHGQETPAQRLQP